jgi:imidazole glycerol-phosphate synthase subunit HisH
MVTIIDYGMGNLRSVQKVFERMSIAVSITSNPEDLYKAKKILLPGVGHFERGIKNLKQFGFFDAINVAVLEKKIPILGICLGMQMMCSYSEEGDIEGLNLIPAYVQKFPKNHLKIPHMGWNSIEPANDIQTPKFNIGSDLVYFVHSYYVNCDKQEHVLFESDYGIKFHSAFRSDHIWGYQFHPEKSYEIGKELLRNFINETH